MQINLVSIYLHTFQKKPNWLVRHSLRASIADRNHPLTVSALRLSL